MHSKCRPYCTKMCACCCFTHRTTCTNPVPFVGGLCSHQSCAFDSHPHAFPTNPPCIRYVDGRHYCTKNIWFESNPDDFPAPFNKAFHFEMGVEATDGSTDDRNGEGGSPSTAPPEMLVDYVRIAQVGWLESAQWHASRQAPFYLRVCGS